MPETTKIEPLPSLGVLPGQMRQRRLIGLGLNSRSCSRVRRVNHRKYWLKENLTRKQCARKGGAAKTFRLENTFPDGDAIAWHDAKTSAAFLGEALRIDLENLIATRVMSSHGYPFWCGDASVPAGHRNRLQQINATRTAIGHFVTAGPVYLTQNRETPLGIGKEHYIDSWIHQIIAPVESYKFGGCQSEG